MWVQRKIILNDELTGTKLSEAIKEIVVTQDSMKKWEKMH